MRYCIFLLFSLFLAHNPSEGRGDSFSVVGENKIWTNVPGLDFNYLIGIENPSGSSDLLLLWDLNLSVRSASPQTMGSLSIVNARLPSQNYLLDGRSSGLAPQFSGPTKSIALIGDADSELVGVPVPLKGKYLLELVFKASNDAQGLFNLEVQSQEITSFWATFEDIAGDPPKVRAFSNLPFDSSMPITIGTVAVLPVPEPSTFVLLANSMAVIFVLRFRLHRKGICTKRILFRKNV